jgi:hypothetical protein
MIERWAKLYANALTDEKLLAVALDSGAPRAVVSATWARLIAYAGQHAPETGSIAGFDVSVWAAWCETTTEIIERLLASARKFGLLIGEASRTGPGASGRKSSGRSRPGRGACANIRRGSGPRQRHRRRHFRRHRASHVTRRVVEKKTPLPYPPQIPKMMGGEG